MRLQIWYQRQTLQMKQVWDMRMMSSAVGAGQASSASKNPGGFRSALLAQVRGVMA